MNSIHTTCEEEEEKEKERKQYAIRVYYLYRKTQQCVLIDVHRSKMFKKKEKKNLNSCFPYNVFLNTLLNSTQLNVQYYTNSRKATTKKPKNQKKEKKKKLFIIAIVFIFV